MFQKNWNPWPIFIGMGGGKTAPPPLHNHAAPRRGGRKAPLRRILSTNHVMEVIHAGN